MVASAAAAEALVAAQTQPLVGAELAAAVAVLVTAEALQAQAAMVP